MLPAEYYAERLKNPEFQSATVRPAIRLMAQPPRLGCGCCAG